LIGVVLFSTGLVICWERGSCDVLKSHLYIQSKVHLLFKWRKPTWVGSLFSETGRLVGDLCGTVMELGLSLLRDSDLCIFLTEEQGEERPTQLLRCCLPRGDMVSSCPHTAKAERLSFLPGNVSLSGSQTRNKLRKKRRPSRESWNDPRAQFAD